MADTALAHQSVVEVLNAGNPGTQTHQSVVEVLNAGNPGTQVHQMVVEVLWQEPPPEPTPGQIVFEGGTPTWSSVANNLGKMFLGIDI